MYYEIIVEKLAWAERRVVLEWITETPTEEGLYWAVRDGDVVIAEVFKYWRGTLRALTIGSDTLLELSDFSYWLGALPIPTLPNVVESSK